MSEVSANVSGGYQSLTNFSKRGNSQNSTRRVIKSAAEDIINTTPRKDLHKKDDTSNVDNDEEKSELDASDSNREVEVVDKSARYQNAMSKLDSKIRERDHELDL